MFVFFNGMRPALDRWRLDDLLYREAFVSDDNIVEN